MSKPGVDPMIKLKEASTGLVKGVGERVLGTAGGKVTGLTERLEGIAERTPFVKSSDQDVDEDDESAAESKLPGEGATKATNIIESIDVGVPVTIAYNQWTEFAGFPDFMKKVENVDTLDETELEFKAQIFLSHRTWDATVIDQVPDERIVWRSKGKKGHVDGAVTFHELAPNLTRVLVVLEYYPQGLFERTGNLWRAQGRRARAELRHFRRHVMTRTILDAEQVEGWRGVIEDGELVTSHDEVVEDEEADDYDETEDERAHDRGGNP